MDPGSIEFFDQLIADHLDRLKAQLPTAGDAPGGETVRLVGRLIERFESERATIVDAIGITTTPAEREILARSLERLLTDLRIFQPHLTPFVRDASAASGRLGLHVVIEGLVGVLLPKGADPVIHLEERHLYATMDLARSLRYLWDQLPSGDNDSTIWEWESEPPVIFFVPDLDPDNALYLPILAHEVGHQAIAQSDLGNRVMAACANELQPLFDDALASGEGLQAHPLRRQLRLWVDEIICDSLATILCGAGFLFAASSFLPGSSSGDSDSTHPYPRERIRLILRQLRKLDWGPVLESQAPQATTWLDELSVRRSPNSAHEEFLLAALDVVAPSVHTVACDHLDGAALSADRFAELFPELRQLLDKGVPPAQVGGNPVEEWHIVAAAWFHRISSDGDSPRAIALAAVDEFTNGRVLRAIELARILHLWNEEGKDDAGA